MLSAHGRAGFLAVTVQVGQSCYAIPAGNLAVYGEFRGIDEFAPRLLRLRIPMACMFSQDLGVAACNKAFLNHAHIPYIGKV